jgi:membrane-bound lytic murein transglycosylase D
MNKKTGQIKYPSILGLFFTILFIAVKMSAQHPVFLPEKFNSVARIDSLTKAFYTVPESRSKTMNANKVNLSEVELTDSLYYAKMNSLGSNIKFVYNDAVAKQIRYLLNPASWFLSKSLAREGVYFPVFEEILDKRKLPLEIKYLSVIESALNPNAVSWCGATGLWQFMPGTGRLMNLEISGEIDERKDLIKSTEMACSYLENNYNRFGDYLLSLAAYNAGPGNVSKAIRKSGGKMDFWKISPYLPRETQHYVPRFMAAVFVMNFVDLSYIDSFHNPIRDAKLVEVNFESSLHIGLASSLLNWDAGIVNELNSFYKVAFMPELYAGKKVYLPYDMAMNLLENKDSLLKIQSKCIGYNTFNTTKKLIYHTVSSGDNIYRIANKYKVTSDDIKRWNKLRSSKIYTGRKLKIYQPVTNVSDDFLCENKDFFYYLVSREEETLASICESIGNCDLEKSFESNHISSMNAPLEKGTLIKLIPLCTSDI